MSAVAVPGFARRLRVGGAALADQVLFAAGALAANVLLARWLPPAEYGAFAVAFTVLLLAGAFHNAVLTEPLLMFGAGTYRDRFRRYAGLLLAGHLALSAVATLALAAAAGIFELAGAHSLAGAFLGLAVATPALLLLVLLRRAFYVTRETQWAMAGGFLQLALTLAGLWLLYEADALAPGRAFLVLGVGALGSSAVLLARLRPTLRGPRDPAARDVAREHWRYGSWSVLGQSLSWASGQVLLVLVPVVLGLEEAAVVAAVVNLFRPLHPVQQSSVALLLPAASELAARGELDVLRRRARRFLLGYAGATAAYGIAITAVSGTVMHHLYRGRYDGETAVVALIALVYTVSTVVQVNAVLLKATGNVRFVPVVWAVSALFTLGLAVPALALGGLEAGFAVFAASYLVAAAVGSWRARRIAP